MDRLLPAVLAVTLLLASTSGALAADADLRDPVRVTHAETPAVLLLDSHNRTDAVSPDTDLSTALRVQKEDLDGRFSASKFDAKYERRNTTNARRAFIDETLAAISADTAAIRATAVTAHEQYVSGDLTVQEYIERLAVLDARARAQLDTLDATWDPPGSNVLTGDQTQQIRDVRVQLSPFSGSLRHRAGLAIGGELTAAQRADSRVVVAASADGLSLSAFQDGQFVREVYRPDNVESGDLSQPYDVDLQQLGSKLYPWLSNVHVGSQTGIGHRMASLSYTTGASAISVDAYIDKKSERVFYERQAMDLSSMAMGETVRRETTGLTMSVYWAYPGGPLGVQLVQSGVPRSGTVTVDGIEIQQYGDTYWMLPENASSRTVVGAYGGGTLDATVVSNATSQGWYR